MQQPAFGPSTGVSDIMRKTNRTKKTNRKARKTTARKSAARKTTRKTGRKTTRKTTRKVGTSKTSKTITAIAKQFISGMKSGKGFTTVINGISKKTNKNFSTICQTLTKSGLCFSTKVNGTKVFWPNFTSKATKNTTNAAQATWCQAMVEWCLATGSCTPRQLQNNSGNQKSFLTFCTNCCTKAITGKSAAGSATTGAWATNWSKSNNRTWKSGKTFKFPTYASRSTSKRTRKAA
jgi:hypothetical protein